MQVANITHIRRKNHFKIGKNEYTVNETLTGFSFLAPCFILSFIFVLIPIVISLVLAFTDANMGRLDQINWVWFDNFQILFKDLFNKNGEILVALKNTMIFVLGVMPLQFGTSLGLALLLNKVKHFNTFLRWAFFVPVMLSLAVTSMLWMNLLNKENGLINTFLLALGASPMEFLDSPKQAMGCIIFISAWQGAGYQMLIFLSGLKNIPKDLYEAASIDRANAWQKFIHITLPSLKPTLVFVFITMLIGAFRVCVQPMIMTGGGPLDSTLTMSYLIYKTGIEYHDVGYSSAIALFYTIIIASVSLTLRKILGGDNEA